MDKQIYYSEVITFQNKEIYLNYNSNDDEISLDDINGNYSLEALSELVSKISKFIKQVKKDKNEKN